jgi:hypothetical protein
MKGLIVLFPFLYFLNFSSFGQANFYLEPQIGTNISFSNLTSPAPPGFYKLNKVGPAYNLLAGIRLGKNVIIETGFLHPVTCLKYKISRTGKNVIGKGSYAVTESGDFSVPLIIRTNFKIKNNNFNFRMGAAYSRQGPAYQQGGSGGFSDSIYNVTHFTTSGDCHHILLLAGIGKYKQYGKIGTFSFNLMYGKGLMNVMSRNIDYTLDGIKHYTTGFLTRGSFISLQLGYMISRRITVNKVEQQTQ